MFRPAHEGEEPVKLFKRRRRLTAAMVLTASLTTVAVASVSPVSADEATDNALAHARAELAYCLRLTELGRDGSCAEDAQAVIDSYAAPSPSPTVTAEPSPTVAPTTPPAPSPTVTATSSPTASPTPTATPTPTPTIPPPSRACPLPAYPTPACTGVPQGWTPDRVVSGSYTTRVNGEVIDGWRVTGSISVVHQNVTVRNSEVYGRIYNQRSGTAYNGLLIEDVTIGPPSGNSGQTNGAIGVCGYTARRVHIRNAPEGWRVGGMSESGYRCGPVVIEDSYARLFNTGCQHTDGVQEYDGMPGTIVRHNTIDMRGVTCSTAPIYLGDSDGDYGGTVVDNLIAGGSYVLRLHAAGSNVTYPLVAGNLVVDGTWDWGPALVSCSRVGTWRDNYVVRIDSGYGVTSRVRRLSNCAETTYASGSVFA